MCVYVCLFDYLSFEFDGYLVVADTGEKIDLLGIAKRELGLLEHQGVADVEQVEHPVAVHAVDAPARVFLCLRDHLP